MLFISSISSDNEATQKFTFNKIFIETMECETRRQKPYTTSATVTKKVIKIIKRLHARTIDSHGNVPLINNIFDFLASDFVEV